jgi:hypothetical protein
MKKAIKPVVITIIFAIVLSITTCDNGNSGSGKLRNIDIVGARALMIAPKNTVSRFARNANNDVFLKQLDDGSWVEVRMTDEEGAEVRMEPPTFIYDTSVDWMIIGFKITENISYGNNGEYYYHDKNFSIINIDDDDVGCYLVNKLNGDVYDFKPVLKQFGLPMNPWGALLFDIFQVDNNGNIYCYITMSGTIIKILIDSSQASAERLTPSPDMVVVQPGFAVDNNGNILYRFNPIIEGSLHLGLNYYRIRTVDGAIIPIDNIGIDADRLFSFNGNIYANIRIDGNHFLYKLEITGNTVDSIHYTTIFNYVYGYPGIGYYYFPDKMVIVGGNYLTSFYKNGTQEIVVLNENIGENIKTGSSNFFILGENEIYKIDPKTGEKQTLIFNNEYDVIYYFEVTSNDIVIINALTFDGKKILANIYPDGRREIISENFEKSETVILEKIR